MQVEEEEVKKEEDTKDELFINFANIMNLGAEPSRFCQNQAKIYLTTPEGKYVNYELKLFGNEIFFHQEGKTQS